MSREKEILDYLGGSILLAPLVHHFVEIEGQLEALEDLPKIKVHPKDPTKQKATPAGKMYKEYFQQYINALKVLQRAAGEDDNEEESPLRRWVNEHLDA
jgi:hypothetical protein